MRLSEAQKEKLSAASLQKRPIIILFGPPGAGKYFTVSLSFTFLDGASP